MDIAAALGVGLALVIGVSGHEFLTHVAASAGGDKSPRFQGRMTPDLRAHADPLGTIILIPLFTFLAFTRTPVSFTFAWGKPHALYNSVQRGMSRQRVLVPLVGPIFTFTAAMLVGRTGASLDGGFTRTLLLFAAVTLVDMTVIELLPLPGRDGGRILAAFLSPSAAQKMEELRTYDALFIVGLFLIFPSVVSALGEPLLKLVGVI